MSPVWSCAAAGTASASNSMVATAIARCAYLPLPILFPPFEVERRAPLNPGHLKSGWIMQRLAGRAPASRDRWRPRGDGRPPFEDRSIGVGAQCSVADAAQVEAGGGPVPEVEGAA